MVDKSDKHPKLSVVIPIFNEQDCLAELTKRLIDTLTPLKLTFEIIYVDDGSLDTSWSIIEELYKEYFSIKGIRFSRNFGHHVAITSGLDYSSGDWVVTMDGDLQDQPEEIPKLLEEALRGFDVVLAKRKNRKHHWFKRQLAKYFYVVFEKLSGIPFDPEVGVFRILSRRAVKEICEMRETSRFFSGLVHWVGFSQTSIDVIHAKRFAGETKYSLYRQVGLATEAILSFTDKPLKICIYLGMFVVLFGAGYAIYIIINALYGNIEVSGYASLMSVVLVMGGITITTIGLVGLYIGRIFKQIKNRPLYIIEQKLNFERSGEKLKLL